jgi:hypothetical protein
VTVADEDADAAHDADVEESETRTDKTTKIANTRRRARRSGMQCAIMSRRR